MLTEEECAKRLKERRKAQREKVLEKEDNRNGKPWSKEEDEYLIKHLHKKGTCRDRLHLRKDNAIYWW